MATPDEPPSPRFATTRWSLVEWARGPDAVHARAALEELCALTWYPLYAYARRRGLSRDDASDATQGFFAEFLAHEGFARAERGRGRLRAFLLGSFQNHLAKRSAAERALKRGQAVTLPLELGGAEVRYASEPAHEDTPERLYAATWARALLAEVMEVLRREYEAGGQGALFDALEGQLAGSVGSFAELAARLGTSAGAIKMHAHRLRTRYRELLRATVRETLADPAELEDELSVLLEALAWTPFEPTPPESP